MYKIAEINVPSSNSEGLEKVYVPLYKGDFDTLKKQMERLLIQEDVDSLSTINKYPKDYYPIKSDRFYKNISEAKDRIKQHKKDWSKEQLVREKGGICKIHDVK